MVVVLHYLYAKRMIQSIQPKFVVYNFRTKWIEQRTILTHFPLAFANGANGVNGATLWSNFGDAASTNRLIINQSKVNDIQSRHYLVIYARSMEPYKFLEMILNGRSLSHPYSLISS